MSRETSSNAEVGVVGLGNMGGGMARRLLETGYRVVGFDAAASARDALEAGGGSAAQSAAEVGRRAAVVIASLPDPNVVRSVILGPGGVLEGAAPGVTIIETSTIDPLTIREVGRACAEREVELLDATVSGQPPQARSGELTFLIGGPEPLLEKHRELISRLSKQIYWTGDVGTAKTVKLVNNLMALGNTAVAAEAFLLGIRCGMDPQRLYDILSTSGGRSHHFNYDFPRVIAGDFRPGFKTSLALKDIKLVLDLADKESYRVTLAPVLKDLYQAAIDGGHGEEHFASVVKVYEAWANAALATDEA